MLLCLRAAAAPVPPLVYTGAETATSAADGNLRPVVGVQAIGVIRANRTHPELNGGLNHTYTHQPMLAWWHGRFWLEFLSATVNEHDDGMCTSLTSSPDGLHWAAPQVAFPPFALPDGTHTIAHQRMGFYTTPDGPLDKLGAGRLLLLSFYGKHPEPNDGTGLGRAVREIHDDGSLGPIYFIRMNAKQPFPGFIPPYPFYTASPDKGFVAACDALLANKLVTAQWWEEDQLDESGFYTVKGKALSYLHRPDGSVLGIWKNRLVATTKDEGRTWTEKVFAGNVPNNASKYWLQRTGDGRYALFLNPTDRLRNPLAVMTSENGAAFSNLWTIHSELPDQRFGGGFKNLGPQYVRGIAEGNGTPPDSSVATWVAYSANKEDIWIARVPVPLTATAAGPVNDTFEADAIGALPAGWNVYSPLWAPVRVVETPPVGASSLATAPGEHPESRASSLPHSTGNNHALELRDEEPYDYARAIRVFPATHGVKISFRLFAEQTTARLEIELLDAHGARPVRLALGEDGHVWACHEGQWMDAGAYTVNAWHAFELEIPTAPTADRCAVTLDGKSPLARPAIFTDPAASVERLSFRTGAYRDRGFGGRDLPGADDKVPAASFLLDDVVITPVAASPK